MLKKLTGILLSLILIISTGVLVHAAAEPGELSGEVKDIVIDGRAYTYNTNTWYYVNGKYIDINSNGIPIATLKTTIEGGDVNLMPIRGIAEALGADIFYQGNDIYRIILYKKYAIDVKIGADMIDVREPEGNNAEYITTLQASCPVVEYNDTIYLPFRDVIRALFVPTGTYNDTKKYINVLEMERDIGFYRIYVSTSGNFDIIKKADVAHDITLFTDEGTKVVSVAKGKVSENFEKFLYRTYVGTDNVQENFKAYKNACKYIPNNVAFRNYVSFNEDTSKMAVEAIDCIAPNYMIQN